MDNIYGLLKYDSSYNLGDEIQSIAAQQFLPKVDYLIDRDTGQAFNASDGSQFNLDTSQTKIKTIYNGWFDGQYCQFPLPDQIDPLFISFHINESDHTTDTNYRVLDDKKIAFRPIASNVAYLKQYEPIGCRDLHTLALLQTNGISAFFSGCLTLTLTNPSMQRTNEIIVVDAHINCAKLFMTLIPENIRQQASYVSQAVETHLSHEKKMTMAQNLLDRLAKAKLVITSRLHTALPCYAFQTPVIFLHDNLSDIRFKGLISLVKSYTNGDQLDVDLEKYQNTYTPKYYQLVTQMKLVVNTWLSKDNLCFSGKTETPGSSIFSVCMNRNQHLEQSLPTWLATQPDEIIVVDWGSKIPIKPLIDKNNSDKKIKLITVSNVDQWNLTRSFNLAAKMTQYSYLLKVDCDTLLNSHFFSYHNLSGPKKKIFFAGNWKNARNDNEKHTNGVAYFKREDFFKVGGYNELITTYGYDDCDLYSRLENTGSCERLLINLDSIQHIEHDNSQRVKEQKINQTGRLDVEIEKNRLISELNLWTGVQSHFNLTKISDCEYQGEYVYGTLLNHKITEALLKKAIQNRLYVDQAKNKKKKLYIRTRNGLSNRLRALASAYNVAKGSDRQLIVIWIPDFHCEALLTDVFKINHLFKDVDVLTKDIDLNSKTLLDYYFPESDNTYVSTKRNLITYDYNVNKDVYIDDQSPCDLYINSACVLNNKHTNWHKESFFLRNMEVIDELNEKIFKFGYDNDIFSAIGVHVRMGQPPDTHPHDDVSAYTEEGKKAVTKWRNRSHWSIFANEMDRLIVDNPKQRFFVCCDNPDIDQHFDHNVFAFKKTVYDRSVEQIKTAVIDLVLLSQTKYMLGSNWSSFTEIAHRLSGKPLKLAGVDF